ncbi:MAG: hypothetical protein H6R10_1901 [Rhodocyclaceae bacterium]|nr:hypothetical protein [Rhodocyclaceae bacterium]
MKSTLPALLAALAFVLCPPVQAHEHHDSHGPQKPTLNAGKKWETDAPLRQAMDQINQAMAAALPRIHEKRFSETDYRGLADTIGKSVGYAIENCKLQPEADAVLHGVIADLNGGAEAMAGKGDASRHAGAVKVLQALKSYGRYFDHPGWKAAG